MKTDLFAHTNTIVARLTHKDDPTPVGYEDAEFLLFMGHHGANGYGAWIQKKAVRLEPPKKQKKETVD